MQKRYVYRMADPAVQREIIRVLLETRSVNRTAIQLGMRASKISAWINRRVSRRVWWERVKKRWSRQRAAARCARWRARRREAQGDG